MFNTIDHEALSTVSGGAARCDLSGLPSAAQQIIQRESGGNPNAQNPHSTAFGLGQLIVANRRALMGSNYASTNCSDQIGAFQKYTLGRYGSYDRALSFHKRNGWY